MKSLLKLLLTVGVCAFTVQISAVNAPLHANPLNIDQLYVFGDSLSDEGVQNNNPDVPQGKQPTWTITGGAVWPTALASLLSIPAPTANNMDFEPHQSHINDRSLLSGTDYAAGGATTNALGYGAIAGMYSPPALITYQDDQNFSHVGQIEYYLAHNQVDPNGLYVIWAGANDLFVSIKSLVNQGTPPTQDKVAALIEKTINNIVANQVTAATLLHNAGAKNIVVLDVPDLVATPIIQQILAFTPTQLKTEITDAIETFSLAAAEQMDVDFGEQKLGFKVYAVDTTRFLDQVVRQVGINHQPYSYTFNGESYTITDALDSACPNVSIFNENETALNCSDFDRSTYQNNYLFADGVHPTTQGHQLIASLIYNRLLAG